MPVTRRSFLAGAAAVPAAAALGPLPAASAASPPGDVVGKITVGYQGWFACTGDGAPIDCWWHWAPNAQQPPSPANTGIASWPDVREYTRTYPTAFPDLGNGQPATLFSSYDQQTVDTHFRWMRENGCDTAALQRFNPFGAEGPTRDAMAAKVRTAAEANGRKFYVMYDVTSWTNMRSELKTDWTTTMAAYTSSPAYARQNGKPVVCIWGFGFNDPGRPFGPAECLEVVAWFRSQGLYVIGGVPTHWRNQINDSRPGFIDVYHAFDMISPWMVGRIRDAADSDRFHTEINLPDQADCDARGIDYQPCVMPGDTYARLRAHGDFMWRQFYNMVRLGAQGIYISMFDEYNEGNQIAKTAETPAQVPAGSGFWALDEDGTFCSSDYYLRLTADGGRMLKREIPLTPVRPTQPVVGGGDPQPTGGVTLRARANGNFVSAENAGAAALIASRPAAGAWETFDLVDLGGGDVALRAHANGRYVCAENAGAAALVASRTAVGLWERFTLVRNADGSVSLRAAVNGRYVCAESAGAAALVANRTAVGPWESFTMTAV